MDTFHGYKLLCRALRSKRLKVAEQLLRNNCRVDSMIQRPLETPLHLAIKNGHERIISMLLARKANVNAKNDAQETPLHCAVARGHVLTVQLLIDAGADINALTKHNKTPFHIAMDLKKNERDKIVMMLLKKGANVDISDQNGRTILYFAVKSRDLPAVKELLLYRPDVNLEANRRCLHVAVCKPIFLRFHKMVVDLLLGYGFNFRAEDAKDAELLHAAVRHGCFKIVETLLNFGADVNTLQSPKNRRTLLHNSVFYGQFEITELLLSHGANVNAEDNWQKLALTYAIGKNYTRMVERLLNAMVPHSKEIITKHLHTAVKKLKVAMVKIFLQHANIDVNARDMSGRTALQSMALENGWNKRYVSVSGIMIDKVEDFRAILKLLSDRGIDVNAREMNGRTALHNAMMKKGGLGCAKVVKLLVDLGADIDIKDENQATPLHLASYIGNVNAVGGLLEFGASIDEKDKLGRTALHVAAKYGHEQVVQRLVCRGADLNLTCNASFTPLEYATNGSLVDYHYSDDDLYMNDAGVSPVRWNCYNSVLSILENDLIAARSLGHRISDNNLRLIERDFDCDVILTKFQAQIAEMKTMMLGNEKISVYDVLTKSMNRLAFYANNESFVKAVESEGKKFGSNVRYYRYYRDIFLRRFEKGKERATKNLLGLGLKSFVGLTDKVVPDYCALEIFDYLENKDLENLIKAYPCGE